MAQIDSTYFIRDINLPGNVLSGDLATISYYIAKYEKQALVSLLGYSLYKDFLANPTDLRWTRFISGYEYTIDYQGISTDVKWNGLVNSDKVSFLAYYVFYAFLKYNTSQTATLGELLGVSENAARHSPVQRMVDSYNNFIDLYGKVNDDAINPSAYNFLYNLKDDDTNGYDGWIFTPLGKQNTFGI